MCHSTAREQGRLQSVARLWNVDRRLDEQRARPIPHVVLFVEFVARPRPEEHLVLLVFVKYHLDPALIIQVKVQSCDVFLSEYLPKSSRKLVSRVCEDSSSRKAGLRTILERFYLFLAYRSKGVRASCAEDLLLEIIDHVSSLVFANNF